LFPSGQGSHRLSSKADGRIEQVKITLRWPALISAALHVEDEAEIARHILQLERPKRDAGAEEGGRAVRIFARTGRLAPFLSGRHEFSVMTARDRAMAPEREACRA
jgi:hypothetical protein